MSKFRTPYNGVKKEKPLKPADPVSVTVPNEAYTIQELIERHKAGIESPEDVTHYFDVEDLDNINGIFKAGVDLTELDELKANTLSVLESIDNAISHRDEEEGKPEPEPEPEVEQPEEGGE